MRSVFSHNIPGTEPWLWPTGSQMAALILRTQEELIPPQTLRSHEHAQESERYSLLAIVVVDHVGFLRQGLSFPCSSDWPRTHSADQAGLKCVLTFLPLPPKQMDYRCALPCMSREYSLKLVPKFQFSKWLGATQERIWCCIITSPGKDQNQGYLISTERSHFTRIVKLEHLLSTNHLILAFIAHPPVQPQCLGMCLSSSWNGCDPGSSKSFTYFH